MRENLAESAVLNGKLLSPYDLYKLVDERLIVQMNIEIEHHPLPILVRSVEYCDGGERIRPRPP